MLSGENLVRLEEEIDFDGGVFFGVGAVDGVLVDRFGEVGADGAGGRIFGVSCAHEGAVLGDGVGAFEDHDENWAGGHEVDQLAEEGALFVDGIEALRLFFREMHHPSGDDF